MYEFIKYNLNNHELIKYIHDFIKYNYEYILAFILLLMWIIGEIGGILYIIEQRKEEDRKDGKNQKVL